MHCTIVLCPIPAIRLLSLSLESVYERAPYFHSHLRYDFRSRHRSSSHLSGTRLMPGSIVMVSDWRPEADGDSLVVKSLFIPVIRSASEAREVQAGTCHQLATVVLGAKVSGADDLQHVAMSWIHMAEPQGPEVHLATLVWKTPVWKM